MFERFLKHEDSEHGIEGKCPSCGRMVSVIQEGDQYMIQEHEGCDTANVAVEDDKDITAA